MERATFFKRWSELHNNADTSGIVGGWLTISYQIAHGADRLRFTPNALTLCGVALAPLALINNWWALIMVPLSLAFDGIDGSLAVIQKRESARGSLYDSLSDRLVESIWAIVLYRCGAPLWAALLFWSLGAIQEYARARIASLGVSDLGVVTVMERPMRASAVFIVVVSALLALPVYAVYVAIALQVFSVLSVFRFANRSLRRPSQR